MQNREGEFIDLLSALSKDLLPIHPMCVHTALDTEDTVVSKQTCSLGAYIMREINH